MYYIIIIVTDHDAVQDRFLIIGESKNELMLRAETEFVEVCRRVYSDFDLEYTQDDIAEFVAEGVFEFGYGCVTMIDDPIILDIDNE